MYKITTVDQKDNYAKFALEPLQSGFGHTFGNSLRRVMLTSLEGSAITTVKIDDVSHQFSTINGVTEDVIEIILNLKKVRVKVHSDKAIKLLLRASGKKDVKAGDFEIVGDGEVVNPGQHIATLSDAKSKLNMELVAEKGTGYSLAEERRMDEIGVMAIDALFSPTVSINYFVEQTRVGKKTNFDKLFLEITTDGTIEPRQALDEAAKILVYSFKQIYEPEEVAEEELTNASAISEEVLKLTVEELDLPVRITNALKAIDVNAVEDLINVPKSTLLKAKNLGNKSLSLISDKLEERGLSLREA